MVKAEDVKRFLDDFKVKLDIWGIIYRDDRGKNLQTLLDLDIVPVYRKEVLKQLQVEDYSEGPKEEKLYGGAAMWIFGKDVKEKEVYIKITLGQEASKVICISFHISEAEMKYPFKK